MSRVAQPITVSCMPDWNLVDRSHVLAAMEEHDRLGSREFLRRYGFRQARAYVVWRNGLEYASKAILGVAYLHATGHAATSDEFSGGEEGAAKVLTGLGFDVVAEEQSPEGRGHGPGVPSVLYGRSRDRGVRLLRLSRQVADRSTTTAATDPTTAAP